MITKSNDIDQETLGIKEHEHCLRCGRKLIRYKNRVLGYGPVCYQKIQIESSKKPLFTSTPK